MRLIDADELEKRIVDEKDEIITDNHHAIGMHNGLTLAQAMIINAPTIDAVPVVRCKDCESHGKCFFEDTFKFARIDNPFCCVGRRRSEC